MRTRGTTDLPEFNVVVFAFLLNYPWEFMQVPLYLEMPEASHWQAIKTCTRATFGDALIMLASFWLVAAVVRSRRWILQPTARQLIGFSAAGVVITVVIEQFAVRSDHPTWGWRYAPEMPLVPIVDVGLTPVLQWVVLPPLAAWFVKRQLSHLQRKDAPERPPLH